MSRPAAGRDFVAAAERPLAPGLRVGFCADVTGRGIEPALVALARQSVTRLADRGATVEEIELDLSSGHETFRALLRLRGIECNAPEGWAEAFHARKLVLAPREAG